ncbi:hypothetical protein EOM89_10220 [Candidatus Falkowbacteria bacterium]|nr:hypothetical protein [Candidatus Falkowbacteria bacterium]
MGGVAVMPGEVQGLAVDEEILGLGAVPAHLRVAQARGAAVVAQDNGVGQRRVGDEFGFGLAIFAGIADGHALAVAQEFDAGAVVELLLHGDEYSLALRGVSGSGGPGEAEAGAGAQRVFGDIIDGEAHEVEAAAAAHGAAEGQVEGAVGVAGEAGEGFHVIEGLEAGAFLGVAGVGVKLVGAGELLPLAIGTADFMAADDAAVADEQAQGAVVKTPAAGHGLQARVARAGGCGRRWRGGLA